VTALPTATMDGLSGEPHVVAPIANDVAAIRRIGAGGPDGVAGGAKRAASDLHLKLGGQFLAFRLRPEEDRDDDEQQEPHGAVHHRQCETHLLIDCKIGEGRRDEAAEDRSLMIHEARGRAPDLRRVPLGEIAPVLAINGATNRSQLAKLDVLLSATRNLRRLF